MSAGDDMNILGQFKEWLGDAVDDDEFGKFADTIMERRGHKRQSSWIDSESDGKTSGGGSVLGINAKRAASGGKSGQGWQYGA